MIRDRVWHELVEAKKSEQYACLLIGRDKRILNTFNLIIAGFSTGGIMGWTIWKGLPLISCIIIAIISLSKLIQPYIVPSEKKIEKLDKIVEFYTDYFLRLEKLWFKHEYSHISDKEFQDSFFKLKEKEKTINSIVNEVHKKTVNRLSDKAEALTLDFFKNAFKIN